MEIQTGYAPVQGARLYYERMGAGPALALLHAGVADRRMWDGQFAALAADYHVIRYDLRGYGQTGNFDGDWRDHDDLAALLDFLAIEQAVVVGCSIGGQTAVDFALAHPARVRALIPVCAGISGYQPPDEEIPPQWDAAEEAFRNGDLERAADLSLEIWLDGPRRPAGAVGGPLRARAREMFLGALRLEQGRRGQALPLDPPAWGQLGQISAPALVVVGALDMRDVLAAADALAQNIPGARKAVIEDAAHLPPFEQPAAFNAALNAFLDEIGVGH